MTDTAAATRAGPSAADLVAMERTAVELAELAGAQIREALGGAFSMHYKTGGEGSAWRDPVSEVDHKVERLVRAHIAERFPEHDIVGEESDERPGRDHDYVWAIDPVDGTSNFVNGYPMFAASIGVLHQGRPVAAALWCSASHDLRAGVYHARAGSGLAFDGEPVIASPNPGLRRRLVGVPWPEPADRSWDLRKSGSAAIDCAFVAAGLLEVARFTGPNIWDVAGGFCLVTAAGGEIRIRQREGWAVFDRFEARSLTPEGATDLRHWTARVVLGQPQAVARMCAALG